MDLSTLISLLLALLLGVFAIGVYSEQPSEAGDGWAAVEEPAVAAAAAPAAGRVTTNLVLVERTTSLMNVDLGDPGPSAGDIGTWGPSALYDEANVTDTGATSQGVCIALDTTGACKVAETIVFPDGSTIEAQGVLPAGSGISNRTIVGGSGLYLDATGSIEVEPSPDFTTWTKSIVVEHRADAESGSGDTAIAASPVAVVAEQLVLVERNLQAITLDVGDQGPSAGDMIVWGPNALYDESNTMDTGATSQGTCVFLDVTGLCLASETIVFADGSSLHIQGVESPGVTESIVAIVGGSGVYQGATGTVRYQPSADFTTWTKTLSIQ
jgi:hypothetical protein